MIELRVLGVVDVRTNRFDGTQRALTQPKRLALLLYLALAKPSGLHSRDQLLALLWPEADDDSSRHSLRNALHALRQAMGDDAIITRGESYVGLDFGMFRCDALELRAHLAAGRADEAVALWTGELAPGFHVSGAPDFERWLDGERVELRSAVQAVAWKRARALIGSGHAEVDAVRLASRLAPSDEPGVQWLMRLLAAAGDRVGAVRAYEELADYLAQELETQPSASTRALAAAVRSAGVIESTLPATTLPAGAPAPTQVPPPAAPRLPTSAATVGPKRRVRRGVLATAARSALAALAALAVLTLGSGSYRLRGAPLARSASTPQAEAERAVLRLPSRYRSDTSAYSSYLRGLTLRFQFRFIASRDTLAALVDRKPLYVPGLYGLAHAYAFATLNELIDPDESWPKVDALAQRALALDSTAASAWLALAAEDMFVRLNLARAGARIARARMLDSLDPDVAGMQSVWFRFFGEMDSAVAEARLAHRIDPLSPLFQRLVSKQLYFARRYEESRMMFARMLQDDPGWTTGYPDFAEVYRAIGRPRDAVEWLRRARAAAGDSAGAAALAGVATDTAALRLLADDARRTIARLEQSARAGERVPPRMYASTYAALGDTLATLRWLDSMIVRHDSYLHQIRVDPAFDFLRRDPRYQAWEVRSGLPTRRE